MILDELVLNNIGTFAGKHSIVLTPTADDRPIILIGGLNGAGKTTFLDSIHLALYGNLANLSNRRSGSYEKYLRSLIHRGGENAHSASVELKFHAFQAGERHDYSVQRSWSIAGAEAKEKLTVALDGQLDNSLASTWSERVDTFLPRGLAGLFFFDGEQIEALADEERSRVVLQSTLSSLLGLDLVDRLAGDLLVLKNRHRSELVPATERARAEELRAVYAESRQNEEAALLELSQTRVELDRALRAGVLTEEEYRLAGGESLDRKSTIETESSRLRAELMRAEEEVRTVMAGAAPLLQITELLERVRDQAELEQTFAREALVADLMQERGRALLAHLAASEVGSSALDVAAKFLAGDALRHKHDDSIDLIVDELDHASLDTVLESRIPTARKELALRIDHARTLRYSIDEIDRALAAIPDPEAIQDLTIARSRSRLDIEGLTIKAENQERALENARTERSRAETRYETAQDDAARMSLSIDDSRRIIDHVDRVNVTLRKLRAAASSRHLSRISSLVLEALSALLRKESLVTEVQIDPNTFEVALTGHGGIPLPTNELSAGERQLLAVALLWGLARAAGKPLPIVIDTPLGRLDGSHREHLLDRYFPSASHQVILLSTDTEIDEVAFGRIEGSVGRAYRLVFDSKANASSVLDGYFWEMA